VVVQGAIGDEGGGLLAQGRQALVQGTADLGVHEARETRRDDPVHDPMHAPSHRVSERCEPVGERHARQCTKGVETDLLDSWPPRGCRLA